MGLWSDIWELFFPRYCAICHRRLDKREDSLCLRCLSKLPRTCIHWSKDNVMEKNFWGCFPIERAGAFLYYSKGGDVQKLLYELKYYGNRRLGVVMGKCMASELCSSNFFEGIDVIIPVPLHQRKKRKRGYNQSEAIAEGIESVLGIPVMNDVLVREQYTDTQTRKSRYGRWENVDEAFVCKNDEILAGKHVLLLDDVTTTGATIVACADAMKKVENIQISVLALALAGET